MADKRKALISFCGSTHISIITPLFSKIFDLSSKEIESIDLIALRKFDCASKARRKSDFIADIKYGKEYRNFSIEIRVYARTQDGDGLKHIDSFTIEDKEQLFEINIVPDTNKIYFPYLENVDECI